MEEYDSYEGSGLELFHLSDVLDYLGEENNYLKIKNLYKSIQKENISNRLTQSSVFAKEL